MRKDICYKCGCELDNTTKTKEHIPPKCLVTNENRGKLIIVPSCKECNNGDSKDIEYFRNWIVTASAHYNKEALEIYNNKVTKSFLYNPSIKGGLRNMISDNKLFSPSGIFLGNHKVIKGEYNRVNPILDSISKAILFHHFGNRDFKFPHGVSPFIVDH